jgi:hypothetical protein
MPSRLPLYLIMTTLVKWHVNTLVLLYLVCGQGAVEHVEKVFLPGWWMPMPVAASQDPLWPLQPEPCQRSG